MPKKTIKKPKPPMEQKRRYEIISTGTRGVVRKCRGCHCPASVPGNAPAGKDRS